MIVQSGGENLYAVLAKNETHHLGISGKITLVSTTMFLALRLRYVAETAEWFDGNLVPKAVLLAGVERSKNTLRGMVLLNTGVLLQNLNDAFPLAAAATVQEAADGFLLGSGECLTKDHIREDFQKDFATLLEASLGQYHPAKSFGKVGELLSAMDMQNLVNTAAPINTKPELGLVSDNSEDPNKIVKFDFANPPSTGVDTDPDLTV